MHKNHILNEFGCLNIHLNINVAQRRARTENVLMFTQKITEPLKLEIYIDLTISLKI